MHATSRRSFLLMAATATAAVSCGTAVGSTPGKGGETRTLRYQGSTGAVTLPELAQDLGYLGEVRLEWVGDTISGPQDIQSAATGQTDFGGAFNGAVVKLVSAGAPVKALIGYYGSDRYAYNGFYVLQDSPIRTASDLLGKKIGMNTLGAHYEAVLDIYLARNGLSAGQIKQVEPLVVPPVNTAQSLRQHQIDVGVLGGILRDKALAQGGIRPLFTDFELLGAFTAGTYVMRNDFIQRNPTTVKTFVTGVAKAIEWSRSTPREEVVERFRKIIKDRKRNEDATAIGYWKSFGVTETGGRISDRDFTTWIDWLENVGQIKKGQVTAAEVYTDSFNAYQGS